MITEEIASAPALVAGEWLARRPVGAPGRAVPAARGQPRGAGQPGRHRPGGRIRAGRGAAVARLAPAARAGVLDRAAGLAAQRRDHLATLLALELGKPVKDGRGEIDRVADTLAVCAAEARRIGGELLPVAGWGRGAGNTALTYRAPAGVALAITPFNAPANLLAHKLGASFAAGNTTIVKAPPQAPASSAGVVELLLDAGMPAEAVQLLHGDGAVGARLCAADEVAVISFTGSAATGDGGGARRRAQAPSARAGRQRGHDRLRGRGYRRRRPGVRAHRVQQLRPELHLVQRVYVQRDRFGEFLDAFTAEVTRLRTGDPPDDGDRRRVDGRRRGGGAGGPLGGGGGQGRRRGGAGRDPRRRHRGPDRGGAPAARRRPSSPARCSARWSPCCHTTTFGVRDRDL